MDLVIYLARLTLPYHLLTIMLFMSIDISLVYASGVFH